MRTGVLHHVLYIGLLSTVFTMLSLGGPLSTEARDLTDVFAAGIGVNAFSFNPDVAAEIAPAISGAVGQAVTQQFPLTSVSPAFTFRFDPTLNLFTPNSPVSGPLFSERAFTLGRGKFNLGLGYSFINFRELNGRSLHNLANPVLITNLDGPFQDIGQPGPNGQNLLFTPVSLVNDVIRMKLQAHVIVPTLRYGITDNWDVGISIPILHTSLKVRTDAKTIVATSANPTDNTFGGAIVAQDENGNPAPSIASAFVGPDLTPSSGPTLLRLAQVQRPARRLAKASGSKTGIGDITLRTKYRFWQRETGGAALGLNLIVPSGDEDNFHGTGDTHLSTFLYLSEVLWDRFEPHLNLGIDFNADDVDRSSFLYTVGSAFQVYESFSLVIDFIGRSEFEGLRPNIPRDAVISNFPLDRAPDTCTDTAPCSLDTTQPQVSSVFFPEAIKRNDTIDFSFGLRYLLGSSGSIFFGGILPLNNDSFRADFIPSGGLEYTF